MIYRFGMMLAALLGMQVPDVTHADPMAGCKTLRISGNPEFAPWSWQDGGELRGASIRIAEQVAEANGVKLNVRFTGPLKRNIALLRGGELDLLVALPKTSKRETFIRFTEFYAVDEVVLVKRWDAALSYVNWDDMRNLTIATTRGNSWGEFLDAFLEKEATVYQVPGLDNVMRMVLVGRADFGLHRYYSVLPLMESRPTGSGFPCCITT
ncbi:substrate-binding periplasmic protein [Aestuariispira insulae]|uniref:Extracellular solute-binding protein (Family 3) n=1 Tax=Aestuariispira insulae TaxID=1461337 RepID=A0A3D9HPA7_9PROT|nr:transporter substrate-binding domain-containing protein [Aestuariispira insulae]RED51320.1 extracellular solute-binding protein (family 3) [Aestuariispira insulae]